MGRVLSSLYIRVSLAVIRSMIEDPKMDELQVEICPDHPSRLDLFVKILINGKIVPEPDYWLNIDTFFSAVGNRASEIEFIGDCGVAGCCADGFRTFDMGTCWQWAARTATFNFSWLQVHEAAELIISEIDKLSGQKRRICKSLIENIPEYQKKIQEIRARSAAQSEN